MVTVYFVQHGIAHPKDVDEKRPLSEGGSSEVCKVAAYLKNHEVCIVKIFHSGKLRARQTAEIFAQQLGVSTMCEIGGMNPNDNASQLIEQIGESNVMYVGHLPNIQNVVSHLVSKTEDHPVVHFQNSAVVCVELGNSVGIIKWFITPTMC